MSARAFWIRLAQVATVAYWILAAAAVCVLLYLAIDGIRRHHRQRQQQRTAETAAHEEQHGLDLHAREEGRP
ncbi:hypothetical protein [Streptomyces sp. CBMA152]|uniref:hypothetical protein n=1 Tax=Streptomyces sp. CBMA152 TaxID=1896312 RepID=UPI0016613514|nr:hypothetical protein [Streptomyces sp. CBMA152]MBD0743512.1 hypothetical protein [Streptomyces sp. CBMA152]